MKAEYRRDPDGHYLVLGDFEHTREDSYSLAMILKNHPAGLLPLEREILNGTTRLVYNITSVTSFADLTERELLTEEILRCLVTDLAVCTDALREYLLEIGKLMLLPEFIFLERETGRFQFCFNPYYTGNYQHDIRSLFDRILEKMDYEDPALVKMTFELHMAVQKDNFRISDLSDAMSRIDSSETVSVRDMFEKNGKTDGTDFWDDPADKETGQREQPESAPWDPAGDVPSGAFGKLRYYLKGKSIREVISDIDNGVFLQKLNRPSGTAPGTGAAGRDPRSVRILSKNYASAGNEQPVKTEEHLSSQDMQGLLTGIPWTGESGSQSGRIRAVPSEKIREKQDQTVLLDQGRIRSLAGIGSQEGTVIEISRYPFMIGKLEEMDGIIDCPSVSRMHARISENRRSSMGSCFIEDLNSTNGTYINGVRIEPYQKKPVRTGDVIRLADQEFVLQ